ncbi:MAG: S-layer homology domain-containing protein [Erysipelotrichaceae bacterium]|nr:S-layer homology domain-containing protein [Erysipelotrichaceae bacterium]
MFRKLMLTCLSFLLTFSLVVTEGLVTTVHAQEHEGEGGEIVRHVAQEDHHSGTSGDGNAYAYIDEGIDKSQLLHSSDVQKGNDKLASSYSLVSKGFVTSVKNQNPYGTCWTFATMASAESGILKKNGKTFDFAELQMAYHYYKSYNKADPMKLITKDGNSVSPASAILDMGGNSIISTFGLASGIGFCKEASYPYTDASTYVSSGTSTAVYKTAYRLRSSRWLNMSEPNVVKQALMDYGALAVSYYHDDKYLSSNNAYYQNYTDGSNHAVTLVGWNDNYSKTNFKSSPRPSSNGAWLIKNSWGTGWGDSGYFWISYEDPSIQNSMAVFFEADMDTKYSSSNCNLYQYDGGCMVGWYNMPYSSIWEANVFKTAGNNETLTDVSFVTGQAGMKYMVYVYKNVSSTPDTGTLATKQSGTLTDAGYYMISLKNPVSLSKGEKFAVVVKLTSTTDVVQLYVDYTYSFSYNDGTSRTTYNDVTNDLSYYSTDGSSWSKMPYPEEDSNRIKAITVTGVLEAPEITKTSMDTDGVHLKWSKVDGADKYMVYRKASDESDYTKIKTVTTTTYVDDTALGGVKYAYVVKAYNSTTKTYSDYSNKKVLLFNPFSDVDPDSSTFAKIMWAYNNKIVSGTSKTTFTPKGTCLRRSFSLMFWKVMGKPEPQGTNPFKDIDNCTANEKKAIQWAYENGIIRGTGKTTFSPNDDVTRKQVVIMLWKALGKPPVQGTSNPFTDIGSLSANEKAAILWAYENGITAGTSATTFSPDNACTRAQLCVFLYKFDLLINHSQ